MWSVFARPCTGQVNCSGFPQADRRWKITIGTPAEVAQGYGACQAGGPCASGLRRQRAQLRQPPGGTRGQFRPAQPNQAWVSDMTYIRTAEGWHLCSRKVVGWAMAPAMPASLIVSALKIAIQQRNPAPGLHSDRGSQYASEEYQGLLARDGLICSMSRLGDRWDNAVIERFFLNLKLEHVRQTRYVDRAKAWRDITQCIAGFYNPVRLHSTLGYESPQKYEAKLKHQTT